MSRLYNLLLLQNDIEHVLTRTAHFYRSIQFVNLHLDCRGNPHPRSDGEGGTPILGWGYPKLKQHSMYLLHSGQYASCVHTGGLSCYQYLDQFLMDSFQIFIAGVIFQDNQNKGQQPKTEHYPKYLDNFFY